MTIEIYECTDCETCIDHDGYRVVCGEQNLPADEAYKYMPLADLAHSADASNCEYFKLGMPLLTSSHEQMRIADERLSEIDWDKETRIAGCIHGDIIRELCNE